MDGQKKWIGTTYGNNRMHLALIKILRHTDIRLLYAFTAVFVVPACLLLRNSRHIMYGCFRKHFGYSRLKSAWMTYKNHLVFGQIVIDRFAMYAGHRFRMDIEGYEHFDTLAKQEKGFIQMSAHVGNYELAGYSLVSENKKFNALVFSGEKEMVMENRNSMFTETNIHMILIKPDMSHLFEIDRALQNGEIVSMPSDRIYGSPKYITGMLLNGAVHLPAGPFKVITLRGLDAIAVNVMKTSWKSYKIHVTPLEYPKDVPENEQMKTLSAAYTQELERIIKMYPAQWFNYYEYWKQ